MVLLLEAGGIRRLGGFVRTAPDALGAGEPYGTWGVMTEADRKLGSSIDLVGDRCVIVPWANRKSTLRSPLGRGMVFEILLRRRCIKEAIR